MAKKYTHIKQRGELAWGGPAWGIKPTAEELTKLVDNVLTIFHRTATVTAIWDDDSSVAYSYSEATTYKCFYRKEDGNLIIRPSSFQEVAAIANYFGDRLVNETETFFAKWGHALVEVEQ